ncbi:hypothetical protein [Shewanella fidelis]|uniref:Uncharacterized protein n=1 Tax=Shewanella fidelis TaxID=173509 RepID=A0AAW8NSU4_9GAMM|nr:hypothetical protein [Shewanella fidelis]MDR8526217.1 hypothetical protein [Shewanella fidelis]MDW4814163.1 hypothetical protein [Shewanella fidelis]MDW4818307.1 hypothetical protein [Shewanella fidelis]MDW4822424.1 hypothetical protein [Shewanella fidelis]MDW4826594.1 hypothetical protein [Shewanella fidelis]
MDTELEQIKKELHELAQKDVDIDSPEVMKWMERAANLFKKDELQKGQIWKYDVNTGLKKVWVN